MKRAGNLENRRAAGQGRRCKAATARATVNGDEAPKVLATGLVREGGSRGDFLREDHNRESGNLSAALFKLALRRAGEATMRKKEWKRLAWVNSTHMFVLNIAHGATAKRLHTTAQGCRAAATLGSPIEQDRRNPNGVAKVRNIALTQRSRGAATMGFVVQPLRGWAALILILILFGIAFGQNASSI